MSGDGASRPAVADAGRWRVDALYWGLGMALIVPLWAGWHFPSEDGLAHLAWTEVFRGLGQQSSAWSAVYERGVRWNTPNLAYFALQYVLAARLDPHLAQKLILTLTVLAWLAASRALSRALTDTVSVGALASLLLIHSSWLYGGYLSFLLGVPVLVAVLAIIVRMLRGDEQTVTRGRIFLTLLGVLGYYCNLVVAGCFLLLTGAAAVAARRHENARGLARSLAWASAPTMFLLVSYAFGGSLGGGGVRWEPPWKTVARFVGLAFFRGFASPGIAFWIALGVVAIVFGGLGLATMYEHRRRREDAAARLIVALVTCLVALYLIAPDGVGDGYNLKGRLQLVMWAWLLPGAAVVTARRARRVAIPAIALLLGWQVMSFTIRARAFNVAYDALVDGARTMPVGSRFDRQLDYDHAGFDGSFVRVLAHAPEELSYHCGCVLVAAYHPSTAFYWVRARAAPPPPVQYHVRVIQLPGAPVSISIEGIGTATPSP